MTLANQNLINDLRALAKHERRITREILEKIATVNERRLYADLGYPSLLAWLVSDLKYTKQAAYRRIEGAKLLSVEPAVKEMVDSGQVNVTTLSMLSSAIRCEEKRTEIRFSLERKKSLIKKIQNKTCEETDRLIATEFPDMKPPVVETLRAIGETETKLTLVLNSKQMQLLKRVKEVTSHSHFNASWADLIEVMASDFLKRKDPMQRNLREQKSAADFSVARAQDRGAGPKAEVEQKTEKKAAAEAALKARNVASAKSKVESGSDDKTERRKRNDIAIGGAAATAGSLITRGAGKSKSAKPISQSLRARIIQRDGPACTFVDHQTGIRCGSRLNIEIDHQIPRALGGTNDTKNLRVLCRAHNRLAASPFFEVSRMSLRRL